MEQKSNREWAFIVNPIAGNGFGLSYLPTVKVMVEKFGINADIVLTERHGHATELSSAYAARGYKYIIGVGGDGTFNEICVPLIDYPEVTTGIIPAGTGNDFIQILGLPNRFEERDWETFFELNTIRMDAGSVNGLYFINGMGLGFDAEVAAQNYEGPGKAKMGGKHKYIWHIIKTLLFFREKRMITRTNGSRIESDCFINTIANGRRFAGSFYLTPEAMADDGLLDVCSIRKLNLLERFKLLMMVPKGTHIHDHRVHYYRTAELNLDFTREVPFHVDGELHFAREFHVRVLPAALNIIYNPRGNHYFRRATD
jgi:diacylglycerol kinase (ATP)